MSATRMNLEWTVTVTDSEHWTQEHIAAAHADSKTYSYEGFAVKELMRLMREAGQAYVDANPDMFVGEII